MKVLIEDTSLLAIANAIRSINAESTQYTPAQMAEAVQTIMDAETYILVDEDGNEVPAVFVESETNIDATANDIRAGKKAVTGDGVVIGTKEIPAYHTSEGYRLIQKGSTFAIPIAKMDGYDFTKLQAIICLYSGSVAGSVAAEKVAINEGVYAVNSTDLIATVTKDSENKSVNFGITNESENIYLIRYITYHI